MDVSYMRQYLISRYPSSTTWPGKVRNMKDNQVIAIYYRMIRSNQEPKKQEKKIKLEPIEKYHQMSLEEYKPITPAEVIKNEAPEVKTMKFHQITIDEYLKSLQ